MQKPGFPSILLALVCAGLALSGAWVYAGGLFGDERHVLGGVSPVKSDNATLYVLEVRHDSQRQRLQPGDVVRVEADRRAYLPIEMDLYIVPGGQGTHFLTTQPMILAHQGPVEILGVLTPLNRTWFIIGGQGSFTATLYPSLEAIVPAGTDGVDLVWVNRTTSLDPSLTTRGMTYELTKVDVRWIQARPWFMLIEGALVLAALVALGFAVRRPRPHHPDAQSTATGEVAGLVQAAGKTLRQLRDAFLAIGFLLFITLGLSGWTLNQVLDDEVPSAEATTAAWWGFDGAAILLVLIWALVTFRANQDLQRWRAFMARGPFTS